MLITRTFWIIVAAMILPFAVVYWIAVAAFLLVRAPSMMLNP